MFCWRKLTRVIAWILRFAHRCQGQPTCFKPQLSTQEVDEAELHLCHLSTQEHFHKELQAISRGKPLPSQSSLLSLQPLVVEDGLLSVEGRLRNSQLLQKHPLILHRSSPTVTLLIRQMHLDHHHAGPTVLLAILADKYYIVGVKRLLKKVIHECIPCKKIYASSIQQQMGQLTSSRIQPSPPSQ